MLIHDERTTTSKLISTSPSEAPKLLFWNFTPFDQHLSPSSLASDDLHWTVYGFGCFRLHIWMRPCSTWQLCCIRPISLSTAGLIQSSWILCYLETSKLQVRLHGWGICTTNISLPAQKGGLIFCTVDCFTLEQRSERLPFYYKKLEFPQVLGSSPVITSHAGTRHRGLFLSFCGINAQKMTTNAYALTSPAAALSNNPLSLPLDFWLLLAAMQWRSSTC